MTFKMHNFLSFLIVLLLFSSCGQDPCQTKDQFLDSFKSFIEEFEQEGSELKEASKNEFETRYENIVNNCYKKFSEELSIEEKQDFWEASLGFYLEIYEGKMSELLSDADSDPFKKYVKDEVLSVIQTSGIDYLNSLAELLDNELPVILGSLLGDLGKMGQELFKIFEN